MKRASPAASSKRRPQGSGRSAGKTTALCLAGSMDNGSESKLGEFARGFEPGTARLYRRAPPALAVPAPDQCLSAIDARGAVRRARHTAPTGDRAVAT